MPMWEAEPGGRQLRRRLGIQRSRNKRFLKAATLSCQLVAALLRP